MNLAQAISFDVWYKRSVSQSFGTVTELLTVKMIVLMNLLIVSTDIQQ